ncbi:hypothetical protein AQUCO_00800018v1 [Aquilegia coerulea]|uniref:Uncharacterized protein n=1 Tax=Aquilegia coerulea TaxID=218851 RepID=A0A2G5EGT8_AQUCA|nr:hypothetical protein AQUCO_00800018v1 [Aquilegia coerulea]
MNTFNLDGFDKVKKASFLSQTMGIKKDHLLTKSRKEGCLLQCNTAVSAEATGCKMNKSASSVTAIVSGFVSCIWFV